MFRMLCSFSRLSLSAVGTTNTVCTSVCRSISSTASLNIHPSPYVLGQPMKKKHRIDPMIEKNRLDRKKRKLEKRIRQLERQARLFKPVEELMPNFALRERLDKLSRPKAELSPEDIERRQLLLKAWSKETCERAKADAAQLKLAVLAQKKALEELKKISPRLYEAAIAPYNEILPYKGRGPNETPPSSKYDTPDGNYVNKSRKWIITASGELI